jgi:flagellar biosynthesis component FlhA
VSAENGARHPISGAPAWEIDRTEPVYADALDATQLIALSLEDYASDRLESRITTATMDEQLRWLRAGMPTLADAVDAELPPVVLTRLCRRLVGERVGVRDLRGLSQLVLDDKVRDGALPDDAELLRRVRHAWRSRIDALVSANGRVPATPHRVPAQVESSIRSLPAGAEADRVRAAVGGLAARASGAGAGVVVTSPDVRVRVRSLVEAEYPDLPVLADDEILDLNGGASASS